MPSCLIEKNERMRSCRNRERNFLEMQGMASLLQEGMTSPAPFPLAGQIAPKI
jgi:hypothetical protein